MICAAKFRIRGVVQGVGFRWFCARAARELGISGYARNCPDGEVEVWAEGEEEKLEEFARALRAGPPAAQVQSVAREAQNPQGKIGFQLW